MGYSTILLGQNIATIAATSQGNSSNLSQPNPGSQRDEIPCITAFARSLPRPPFLILSDFRGGRELGDRAVRALPTARLLFVCSLAGSLARSLSPMPWQPCRAEAAMRDREARQGFQGNNVARKDDNDALRQARTLPPCAACAAAQGDRAGAAAVGMRVKRASPLSSALMEENAKASSDRGGNSPPSQVPTTFFLPFSLSVPPPAPASRTRSPSHSLCASATSSCLPALPTLPTSACLSVCHPGLPSPWKTSTISFGEQ